MIGDAKLKIQTNKIIALNTNCDYEELNSNFEGCQNSKPCR